VTQGVSSAQPHSYVIRRTQIHTFGRWRTTRCRSIVQLRQPPWQEGWIDGPARDPDHFAGNADRDRSGRPSARPIGPPATPREDRPAALILPGISYGRRSDSLLLPIRWPLEAAPTLSLGAASLCSCCRAHDTAATIPGGDTSSVVRRNRWKPMHLQHPAAYLLIIEVRSFGPEGMETKRDGQPADGAIRRDRPPGSSRVPRRRVHLQGRADRLASSSSVLRRLGEGPRRDSQPDRRARSHLELQLPSITGRLTLLATGTTE
jgi:hypothetical protein